jgi:dienelactone hydrolase
MPQVHLTIRLIAAACAAAFLAAAPARAEMKTQWVEYSHGEAKLKGFLAYDDSKSGKRPAVFMIHDKWGMSENTQKQAQQWAKLGYVVFAADIYGVVPQTDPETGQQTAIYRADRALMKARTQAGFDVLLKNEMVDPAKVAMIGYCFGGTVNVEFGATGAPLAANIIIHGSYGGHEPGWAKNIKGAFVMLHGAEDPNFPRETDKILAELRAAKVPFELQLFSGTGHGFSKPKNKAEERANAQAIASATRIMKELFGG